MKSYRRLIFRTLTVASIFGSSVAFAQSTASTAAKAVVAVTAAAANTAPSCTLMDPQVFTQNAVDQVLGILAKDKTVIGSNFSVVQQDIQGVLSPIIGIEIMSKFVVPSTIWAAAASSDQLAFEDAFLQFNINLYSTPLKDFANQTIEVYSSRVDWTTQSRVQINSVIHNPAAGPGADIPVSFILQKNGCSWLFIDFVVDNISALANIQQQIQAILQNLQTPGLAALTAVIAKHNASTS